MYRPNIVTLRHMHAEGYLQLVSGGATTILTSE